MVARLSFYILAFCCVLQGSLAATTITVSGDIQAAVDQAVNGDTVLVPDDTYNITSPITITKNIMVISENGPVAAIVDGGGTNRCFDLGSAACVLSGLTIMNGYTDDDGGAVKSVNATITNCVIIGNVAEHGGGVSGGVVFHSTMQNNMALTQGGGCYDAVVHNSLIVGNTVANTGAYGGGAQSCDLYNCTVVGNSARDGGGADTCDIYNSIIYSNEAPDNPDSAYSSLYSSCSRDGDNVEGTFIQTAPFFVDFTAGDYRLQQGSPCKNTGNNAYVFRFSVDLDGNARIIGGTVDMGAFEIQATPSDLDADGMLDTWEIAHFGSTNAMPDDLSGDDDIFDNLQEYIAGTDPTNSDSFFAVTNWSTGSFILQWASVPNREYQVYWTDSLTNGFQYLEPTVEHPQNSFTDTTHTAESAGFYKVKVQLK